MKRVTLLLKSGARLELDIDNATADRLAEMLVAARIPGARYDR